MAKKLPFHLRFYVRYRFGTGQIHYHGNNIAECVVKAQSYCSKGITSFTILEGEGKGTNIKFCDYMNEIIGFQKFTKTKFVKEEYKGKMVY